MPLYSYENWGGEQSYLQRRNFSDDPNHVNLGIILSKFGAIGEDRHKALTKWLQLPD